MTTATRTPALDLDTLADLAARLAEAGGAAAMVHFRSSALLTRDKGGAVGFDPVTVADQAAEAAIRAILAIERPDDSILGEEEEARHGTSGLTWVIDPIDGTRAFISGLPTWGVLVALDDGTEGRIGVIEQPFTGERFVGVNGPSGARAWMAHCGTRRTLSVRPCADLGTATLFTTAPEMFTGADAAGFASVHKRARLTRYGIDCYAYALLALGQIDLVIEAGLQAYDIAAPAAVIRAAGGVVTDWQGGDPRWGGRVVAAGDPRVHAQALALLNG
jgi:histidinol phosphatase-like enzyme (inositol monophosphatase family)